MDMKKLLPIERAAQICGGVPALAELMKCSPQAVYKWVKKGVPIERCKDIENATNGQVTRCDLRPDIFGAEVSGRFHQQEAA